MILFIIMIILVSSLFRPRYYGWFGPRMFFHPRPFMYRRHMMRGPRPMGPMHGPMGRGPRF